MHRLLLLVLLPVVSFAQNKTSYLVQMPRTDGRAIAFNMSSSIEKGKTIWVITNATEKLRVDSIVHKGDSVFVDMPFFDSRMRLQMNPDRSLTGTWIKGTSSTDITMPIIAKPGLTNRFDAVKGDAKKNITGKYAVTFTKSDGSLRKAVAEFSQVKNKLTGTFLNPSGDYRFLEGIVTGDSLMLSCFDGSHAYFFSATINKDGSLKNGVYCSGPKYLEAWDAVKDPNAKIDESSAMVYMKDGEERLSFRFPDLDSNMVSINDERFKNKVVIIQIMGSWCPNCMDETAFLSDYYNKNRHRGIEVIGLAYEYSTDFHKAERTLRKFQKRYQVEYPMLNTGAVTSDSLRTEKTLPQITPIKAFPTTIFIGKDGRVSEIHPGFDGPGTDKHHEEYKKRFYAIVDELLKK